MERKFYLMREIVKKSDIDISKVTSTDNIGDTLATPLSQNIFENVRI